MSSLEKEEFLTEVTKEIDEHMEKHYEDYPDVKGKVYIAETMCEIFRVLKKVRDNIK